MNRMPTVDALRDDLHQLNARAAALCDGLSGDDLARRADPQRWSIAENLEHLRITAGTFLPFADHAIDETRARRATRPGPFRLGLYGRMLVRYVEPPPLMRLPAPAPLRPLPSGPADDALARFLEAQHQMERRFEASEGLDLTAVRFPSPLSSLVRMNLLEFFAVFNGHTRRHLWQGEKVRREIEKARATGGLQSPVSGPDARR